MEVTIRVENSGTVLYSTKLKKYLKLSEEGKPIIQSVLKNIENNSFIYSGISEEDISILKQIGFDGKVRVLHSNMDGNRLMAPLEFYFDYTSNCNLRCEHCYNKKHLGGVTMKYEDIVSIISEMYDMGIMRLHLAGGEPTIDKKGLEYYLSTAHKRGIVTSMATNGTLIDEEVSNIIMQNKLMAVSVSIDGWNEETNILRRGYGKFNEAVQGTKELIRRRNELKTDTEVCIKPVYETKDGIEFFENMIQLALEIGVDKIKFANPERSLNHEKGHYAQDLEAYYRNADTVNMLREKYKGQIAITNINNPLAGCPIIGIDGMRGCIGARELLTINPDGRFTPCLMDDYDLGNYYDYHSIRKMWNESEKLLKYYKESDSEECHSCSLYSQCRGGCQVRKIVQYGQIYKKDPLCPFQYATDHQKQPKTLYENRIGKFIEICVGHSL